MRCEVAEDSGICEQPPWLFRFEEIREAYRVMKAKRSRRKDGRRPRLIETCHFISFFTKMKTAMRNTLYFSAFEPGTFFDSAAQERLFIWRDKMADS